jgi:hypothetical protein
MTYVTFFGQVYDITPQVGITPKKESPVTWTNSFQHQLLFAALSKRKEEGKKETRVFV